MEEVTYIIDFDGTAASNIKQARYFRKDVILKLSERTGLNIDQVTKDFNYSRRKVLRKPWEDGWLVKGYKTAFADEDYYTLYSAAAKDLYRSKPVYQFCKDFNDYYDFLRNLIHNSMKNVDSKISHDSKESLQKIMNVVDVVIVSSGSAPRIKKALNNADLKINLISEAKKMVIDPTFDKIDMYLAVGDRKIVIRRPNYYEILNRIEGKKTVVGDVFSLDLSLPYYLGINIVLKENPYTPKWSKDFVKSKGKVIKKLSQLLDFI